MRQDLLNGRIKLRHLQAFLEVARHGSTVGAAAALGVSQPAVSKTLAELEALLGVALFERSGRRLVLTAWGETFLHYARSALATLRQGLEAIDEAQRAALVRVAALPTVSARILPAAMARLSRQNAGLRAEIITGPNDYLLSLLRDGRVDLMLGRMADPADIAGLAFEHLYSEPLAAAVRPGHPLLGAAHIEAPALEAFPLLIPPMGAAIRPSVDRFLARLGVAHAAAQVESVSESFARRYLRLTDAVWFISRGVVEDDIGDGLLSALPMDMRDTLGPVGVTIRLDLPPSASALRLLDAIRTVAAARHGASVEP